MLRSGLNYPLQFARVAKCGSEHLGKRDFSPAQRRVTPLWAASNLGFICA